MKASTAAIIYNEKKHWKDIASKWGDKMGV